MSAFIPWCWEYTIILLMILPGLAMSIAILFFGWEGRSLRIIYRDNGDEYLRRYAIRAQQEENQDSAWRIFLHHFLLPDGDAHLHNHPWVWSFSIVLWGSYEEEYFDVSEDGIPGPLQRRVVGLFRRRAQHTDMGVQPLEACNYADLGWSKGMQQGLEDCKAKGLPYEVRSLIHPEVNYGKP